MWDAAGEMDCLARGSWCCVATRASGQRWRGLHPLSFRNSRLDDSVPSKSRKPEQHVVMRLRLGRRPRHRRLMIYEESYGDRWRGISGKLVSVGGRQAK